jgi:hypothetical protein
MVTSYTCTAGHKILPNKVKQIEKALALFLPSSDEAKILTVK